MKTIECKIQNNGLVIRNISVADSFLTKLIGLMFLKNKNKHALLLKSTPSIHTCFMFFDIDVLFINSKKQIVKIIRKLTPWRVTGFYFEAAYVLEIPTGIITPDISVGDTVEFDYV